MEGQQLPKATMNFFLKSQTSSAFSGEYLSKMLQIAKEFVSRLSDKSNMICEGYQKKTINTDHLEAALSQFGLTSHLGELKKIEENIKEQNQLKKEATQRLQEMLAKDLQQERQRRKLQQKFAKQVNVRQQFDQIEKIEKQKQMDFDYQNLEQGEVQIIEKMD